MKKRDIQTLFDVEGKVALIMGQPVVLVGPRYCQKFYEKQRMRDENRRRLDDREERQVVVQQPDGVKVSMTVVPDDEGGYFGYRF